MTVCVCAAAGILVLLWLQIGAAVFLSLSAASRQPSGGSTMGADLLAFCLVFWPAIVYVGISETKVPKSENAPSHRPGSELIID